MSDTRQTYRPALVREALLAAGRAVADVLEPVKVGAHVGPRAAPGTARAFVRPESWAELRRLLHTLDADMRASALVALLTEACARDEHEQGLAWHPHGRASRAKGDG